MKRYIAEFQKQNFTQVIFPHKYTDWNYCLDEAVDSFVNIINTISRFQKCLVVCSDIEQTRNYFSDTKNIEFVLYERNYL